MNLVITNIEKNTYALKPFISGERNIESLIARVKMIVLENPEQQTVLDLRKINFLDCIKIGTIIGTYHFLEFSGKKIHMLVDNEELQRAIDKLCFDNIEIHVGSNKFALESIA